MPSLRNQGGNIPAALDIDREAVKTLAIAIGVREAARQMGLNENTVVAWSDREGWFTQPEPKPLPPSMQKQVASGAIKASEAMVNALADDARETKLSLSKGVRRAAKWVENQAEPILFAGADKVRQLVASASTLHGWEEGKGNQGFTLQVLSIGGQTGIKITQGE